MLPESTTYLEKGLTDYHIAVVCMKEAPTLSLFFGTLCIQKYTIEHSRSNSQDLISCYRCNQIYWGPPSHCNYHLEIDIGCQD